MYALSDMRILNTYIKSSVLIKELSYYLISLGLTLAYYKWCDDVMDPRIIYQGFGSPFTAVT